MSVSDHIRSRIAGVGAEFRSNDNIAAYLEPGDLDAMQAEVQAHMDGVLRALVIDTENDHNTRDTARRFAKMLCREVFAGRFQPRPVVTDFPNVRQVDECYAVGPINLRSCCAHHLVPIMGQAWVGCIPGSRVIGLSKFHRIAEWVMTRPQIQEEATEQLADELERAIGGTGALGVIVRAKHLCCGWRGVRDEASEMTTSVMRGAFRHDGNARREFLALIRGMEF